MIMYHLRDTVEAYTYNTIKIVAFKDGLGSPVSEIYVDPDNYALIPTWLDSMEEDERLRSLESD